MDGTMNPVATSMQHVIYQSSELFVEHQTPVGANPTRSSTRAGFVPAELSRRMAVGCCCLSQQAI